MTNTAALDNVIEQATESSKAAQERGHQRRILHRIHN